MKAVLLRGTGGVEVLHIAEHPDPIMKEDELLVRIHATALTSTGATSATPTGGWNRTSTSGRSSCA